MPRTWPETQRSQVTEVRPPEGTNDPASGGRGRLERQEEGPGGAPPGYCPSVDTGGSWSGVAARSAPGPGWRGDLPRVVEMGEESRNSPL